MNFRVVLLALSIATSAMAEDAPREVTVTESEQANLVGSLNDFASDLYGVMPNQDGNIFFSPESIAEALAMTYAGARGQTANETAAAMPLRMDNDYTPATMGELLKARNERSSHGGYSFAIANAIWVQKDYEILPEFTDIVTRQYEASAQTLDFALATANETINSWVEERTNHKIKNLIPAGALTPETRMVLTNAVYFKADWKTPFKKSATVQAEFHLNPAQNSNVSMMVQECKNCRYSENEIYQAIGIPYQGDDIEMVIFLPRASSGLIDYRHSFNPQLLREWTESLKPVAEVKLFLPRFHLETEYSLKKPLQALGIKMAFDSKHADFTGMAGKHSDVFISDVIHKAYIDVDESGTEAAAATGVLMVGALAMANTVPEFHADHPFIFALRDMHSGSVYFMGRVENPTTN